jgi:hypothetical protein
MKESFKDAYLYGKQMVLPNATLDGSENSFIGKSVADEMKFMTKFADDIQGNTGVMSYDRRIKMYSASLNAMFTFGKLVYMPDEVKIIWTLGITDKHCATCLSIAARNPYTKKTLPTVPKAGATICISNCRCSLNYIIPNTQTDYENFLLKLDPAAPGELPNEEQYKVLMNLQNQFYSELYKKEYYNLPSKNVDNMKDQIATFVTQQGIKDINLVNNSRIAVDQFNLFKSNKNFTKVDTLNQVLPGDIVSYFENENQSYLKVIRKFNTGFEGKSIDGRKYLISPERSMLFKYV